LPLNEDCVDLVTVAFGVRNFEDLGAGLRELVRVLKPGGTLLILEFSHPEGLAAPLLSWWVRNVPPRVGRWISGDPEAYSYLPASVGSFATVGEMCAMLEEMALKEVCGRRLTGGVATLYEGRKS
jgi:demethylmenaquinone methyltransferase/2-methoxy-6-polyprenyl-1,4-benzoquinol methylase